MLRGFRVSVFGASRALIKDGQHDLRVAVPAQAGWLGSAPPRTTLMST
jgi:hypothetical protein